MITPKVEVQKPTNGVKTEVTVLTVPPSNKNLETKEKNELPPLDERLLRLNELFSLQGKYNKLQDSKVKLSDFQLKKGEENITLSITDRNSRHEFSTSNNEVIKDVLKFVSKTIDEKIKATEPLLKW